MSLWLFFASTAGLAALACFPVHSSLVRWGIIDKPNERSSHQVPTARGGGIALLLAMLPVCLAAGAAADRAFVIVGLAGTMMAIISFIDDIRSLPGSWRFGCHIVAALAAYLALFGIGDLTQLSGIAFAIGVVFWIVGHTNAFNFMDGINGLAGGQAMLTGMGGALLAHWAGATAAGGPVLYSAILGGAAAGFLPHNFPRARMFMGDVGSTPVGFFLAVLAFWIARDVGWEVLPALLLLEANFVLDSAITLARRAWRGARVGAPHRDHYYQRLARAGYSHSRVTGIHIGLQLVALLLLVIYIRAGVVVRWGIAAIIIGQWVAFMLWADRQFNKNSEGVIARGR